MSFPFFQQQDAKDCGPTCLRMIAKNYGKNIPVDTLRRAAEIGKEGVSILGIAQAAESIGLQQEALQISFAELKNAPLPTILHWKQKHFVVVYKISATKVFIADPAIGKIKFSISNFLQHWCSSQSGDTATGVALTLQPTEKFYQQPEALNPRTDWQWLLQYTRPHGRKFLLLILLILLGSIFQYIFPYLTQAIVDKGIHQKNLQLIQLLLIGQLFLFITQIAVDFIRSRLLLVISTNINLAIISGFWKKLLRLPLYFFDSKLTGDILQRISDYRRIESFITGAALQTFFSMLNLVIFSIILLRYNISLFLIFYAGTILYTGWIYYFLRYRRQLEYSRFSMAAKENSAALQIILGIHEIKLNNAEDSKRTEWEKLQQQLFALNFKSLSLNQLEQSGAVFINQGKNLLITYLVAHSVVEGSLTIGMMMAIQYIVGQLNSPVDQLISFTQQAQDAKISMERMNEIQQLEDEEPANAILKKELDVDKSIVFNKVNFTYAGAGNSPALQNISCRFESGQVTAIVGSSGSGKTTLIKLLQKFYLDYTGEIAAGSNDLKNISPSFWRSSCGAVMQEGYIFSDSIAKNIAVKEEHPDKEKLTTACKVACILEFIESLPLGFDSKIGGEGSGLSTGQKQRILIARAVYKNPAFLFFDEATNALDASTEKMIVENLQHFFADRTVLVVAHRLSTVKKANKIIVLEKGEIIEEGTHESLVEKKGKYFELVKNQLELGE